MSSKEFQDLFSKLIEKFNHDNAFVYTGFYDPYWNSRLFDIIITFTDDNISGKASIESIMKVLCRMIILSQFDEPYFMYKDIFEFKRYTKMEIPYNILIQKEIKKLEYMMPNENIKSMNFFKNN